MFGWFAELLSSSQSSSASSSLWSEENNSHGGSVVWSLLCAIAAPMVLALVNLFDKVAVDKRVWDTYSYTAVVGIFEMLLGGLECAVTSWENVSAGNRSVVMWPIIGGVIDGASNYLYFVLIGLTDASIVVGIQYIYPAVVCILSYIFLGEALAVPAYIGVAVLLAGAVVLSTNGLTGVVRCFCPRADILVGMENVEKDEPPVVPRDKPVTCWYPDFCDMWAALRRCCCRGKGRSPSVSVKEHSYGTVDGADGAAELAKVRNNGGDATLAVGGADAAESDDAAQRIISGTAAADGGGDEDGAEGSVAVDVAGGGSSSETQQLAGAPHKKHCIPPQMLFALLAVVMILAIGTHEFLMAFGTKKGMKEFQVSGIETMVQGFTIALAAFVIPDARHCFLHELAWNWFFAFVHSLLSICAQLLTVRSLHLLPAAVSFSLCAIQPLGVLVLETICGISAFRVSQCFAFKLPPIVLTVLGVVLLSLDAVAEGGTTTSSSSASSSSSILGSLSSSASLLFSTLFVSR